MMFNLKKANLSDECSIKGSRKFLGTLLASALLVAPFQQSFAQINLSMKGSNLGAVIKEIKSQSNYQFFYDDDLASTSVSSVNLSNASISEALDKVLEGKGISYKVDDNVVYLSRKGKADNSESQIAEQQRTVSGKVVDSKGEPLIGVTVLEKGTTNGAITDFDGNYSLEVAGPASVLQFSYVGYKSVEFSAANSIINVTMGEDTEVLEEVVVTALGIKRSEKALSYNVQQVNADEITSNKDVNFVNSLSGKVAGVTINASSSGVGGISKVVMRGTKSIMQSSNALYVIDGVPMYSANNKGGTEFDSRGATEPIADINPEDIESMSVLTGAAAAALYGSDAANGAIVITTKKGKEGRVRITVNSNTEFTNVFVAPDFQNRYGTGSSWSSADITRSWGERLNDYNYYGYDPVSDYFRTGITGTESISLSTGTDKNQTYASAAAVNSRGIVSNNKLLLSDKID